MRRLFSTMPAQTYDLAWRQIDSDNDILRKILNNINSAATGTQANAASSVAFSAGGFSSIIDTFGGDEISAFGHVSAATTITVQVSADGITFYDTSSTQVLGAAADFHIYFSTGARYVRLKSSAAVTITATIQVKK